MKMLINVETFGLRLYHDPCGDGKPYLLEFDDTYAPTTHEVRYETLDEAIGDMVTIILDPDQWYCLDEQPEDLQKAYSLGGCQSECNPVHPEINATAGTFLYYVLDGIAHGNEEE